MYNLSLPKLCATLLVDLLCLQGRAGMLLTDSRTVLYCAVPYIIACVDVSRTVSLGPFSDVLRKYMKWLWQWHNSEKSVKFSPKSHSYSCAYSRSLSLIIIITFDSDDNSLLL